MNSKEFVKQVFEMVWNSPGAKVEHYKNGIGDWPGRENYYTYEDTLENIKHSLDYTLANSEHDNKSIKNINFNND